MSTPTPDLANAARHMLGECIRDACGEDVNLPAWVADEILAEYDRRGTGQAWTSLIASNERMGKALTEIGLALGLPAPSERLHWGAPEILRRIRAQQAECGRGHPAASPGADTPAARRSELGPDEPSLGWDLAVETIEAALADPKAEWAGAALTVARALYADGFLTGARPPLPTPTATAALLALCDALDRLPASEGGSGRSVSVEEIRRLLRAPQAGGTQ